MAKEVDVFQMVKEAKEMLDQLKAMMDVFEKHLVGRHVK